MFEDSSEYLEKVIRDLKNHNLSSADSNASMMEAYLPISQKAETINRIVSRYVTIVHQYCDDDYRTEDGTHAKLIDTSQLVYSLLEGEAEASVVESQLREIQSRFEFEGEVQRVDEDSAWGQMAKSIISEK